MHVFIASSEIPDGMWRVRFVDDLKLEFTPGLQVDKCLAKRGEVSVWRQNDLTFVVVGVGNAKTFSSEDLRQVVGKAGRTAESNGCDRLSIVPPGIMPLSEELQAITEGAVLGTYAFDKYKAATEKSRLEEVRLVATPSTEGESALQKGMAYARAVTVARDLANEPPNILRPEVFAAYVQEYFSKSPAQVTVYRDEELIQHQLVGLLSVGKGSVHPPCLVRIRLEVDPSLPLIALVGKGITFDSGGISLKSGRDLSDMRMDMSGAAAVVGALDALVNLHVPCNVVGYLALAENIPDAGSMLPGELLQYPNGVSVQVANTDAEGRLVLADALLQAEQAGAETIIDIATLTGAAAHALGFRYAAVLGSDALLEQLGHAGKATGDWVWPLPLVEDYEDQLKSVYADISNLGKGSAGAITAALFLRHFVPKDRLWAHIDMAGPMEAEHTEGYCPAGATGFGARIMAEYVTQQVPTGHKNK